MIIPASEPPSGAPEPDSESTRTGPGGPDFAALLAEGLDFLAYARSATVDLARLEARRALRRAVRAAWRLAAGAVMLVTTILLLAAGIAGAFAAACGSIWAGCLLAGALGLLLVGGIPCVIQWWQDRRALARTRVRYQQWKRRQRDRHGRDVSEAAMAAQRN